jgi:hypothetical protein
MYRLEPFDPAKTIIRLRASDAVSITILTPAVTHHCTIGSGQRRWLWAFPNRFWQAKRRKRLLHPEHIARFDHAERRRRQPTHLGFATRKDQRNVFCRKNYRMLDQPNSRSSSADQSSHPLCARARRRRASYKHDQRSRVWQAFHSLWRLLHP